VRKPPGHPFSMSVPNSSRVREGWSASSTYVQQPRHTSVPAKCAETGRCTLSGPLAQVRRVVSEHESVVESPWLSCRLLSVCYE
jgi:hypothetical protein